MYRAENIKVFAVDQLAYLAKSFIKKIVLKRIQEGIYDEDPDGFYSIEPSDNQLRIDVWVTNTYDISDWYLERQVVKQICIDKEVYVVLETDDEVYLRSLPFNSIVDICNELEDIYDEEFAE